MVVEKFFTNILLYFFFQKKLGFLICLLVILSCQLQAIDEKIRQLSNCHIVYTGIDFQKVWPLAFTIMYARFLTNWIASVGDVNNITCIYTMKWKIFILIFLFLGNLVSVFLSDWSNVSEGEGCIIYWYSNHAFEFQSAQISFYYYYFNWEV